MCSKYAPNCNPLAAQSTFVYRVLLRTNLYCGQLTVGSFVSLPSILVLIPCWRTKDTEVSLVRSMLLLSSFPDS